MKDEDEDKDEGVSVLRSICVALVVGVVMIAIAAVGKFVTPAPRPPANPQAEAQHAKAVYVREHHCVPDSKEAGGNEWNDSKHGFVWYHGYQRYRCESGDILIYDDEEQP